MTFSGMSARHPDSICAFPQSRQDKFRVHPSCAWDSDHPDISWVLHPGDTGKIRCTVTAPITEKADYFYFFFIHYSYLLKPQHLLRLFLFQQSFFFQDLFHWPGVPQFHRPG